MTQPESPAQSNAQGDASRQRKRDPMQPETGSLENQNVTGSAPIDQPPVSSEQSSKRQPAGLENQNITKPAPPK